VAERRVVADAWHSRPEAASRSPRWAPLLDSAARQYVLADLEATVVTMARACSPRIVGLVTTSA